MIHRKTDHEKLPHQEGVFFWKCSDELQVARSLDYLTIILATIPAALWGWQ